MTKWHRFTLGSFDMRLCGDILLCFSLLALCCPSSQCVTFHQAAPHSFPPILSGSSGAGVPTEAAARAGRSSKENHPAA